MSGCGREPRDARQVQVEQVRSPKGLEGALRADDDAEGGLLEVQLR